MNLNVTASQIKMTSTLREQLRLKSNETVLEIVESSAVLQRGGWKGKGGKGPGGKRPGVRL